MRKLLSRLCLLAMIMWILTACTSDTSNSSDTSSYNEIAADQLAPTGCETYIGGHPVYPGELYCCSAPSEGSAPECAAGDTPDIACVIEYQFCDDGIALKAYSPDPVSGRPGHTISTSGSWTVDSDTGELEIITSAYSVTMGVGMTTETTETYPNAFTYDSGNKLDLNALAAVTIDSAGLGTYQRSVTSITDISGTWAAVMNADMVTDATLTSSGYDSTYALDVDCTPEGSMVCLATPPSETTTASGTHTMPLDLYLTPASSKMYQTDLAEALVFEKQPNVCAGIDDGAACGEHGICGSGVCQCTHGYIGAFCDVPALCAEDCGDNATCISGSCVCNTGWEGDGCETDINECAADPCLNGGSCAEGDPGTYACTCTGDYAGDNCETCSSDTDRDGYGDPASDACTYTEADCDDTHASVYPGAPELCDGLDNQCSGDGFGTVDEGYTDCGPMVSITSDCFNMGDAFAEGWPDELPVHEVCLSAFEMDRHEITNAEYAECVSDGDCTAPSSSGSYSRSDYYGNSTYDNYPVIWMEWQQVVDYCTWAGKRLPTEAEWEYAARGGLEGKRYPWGDTIDSTNANYGLNEGDTVEVETYAPNGFGLYDMAGNVWEWVADWFSEDYYSDPDASADDPTGASSGAHRVLRGGSFDHDANGLRVAGRCDFCHVDRHGNNRGARCVR